MMFYLEASRHGLILNTPLCGIRVSFMRKMWSHDALESGVLFEYGGMNKDAYGFSYPKQIGFMWCLSRRILHQLKDAIDLRIYP